MTQYYSVQNITLGNFAIYEHATGDIVQYAQSREDARAWVKHNVLYLRKEPAFEMVWHAEGPELVPAGKTVCYYREPQAIERIASNPWPSRPTRRNKWVMLNGARYRACWLEDLK